MEGGEIYWALWWNKTTFVEDYSYYCSHISDLRGYDHSSH